MYKIYSCINGAGHSYWVVKTQHLVEDWPINTPDSIVVEIISFILL